jgi:hypothetical protein
MARERAVGGPGSHDALQQPPWEVVRVTAVRRREKTDPCSSLPKRAGLTFPLVERVAQLPLLRSLGHLVGTAQRTEPQEDQAELHIL